MKKYLLSAFLLVFGHLLFAQSEECTIGVASGRATADGRPLLWKTRDMSSAPDNKIQKFTHLGYTFIAVTSDGSSSTPWMGLNEHGFAIVNSTSDDMPGGSTYGASNGSLMQYALAKCKTLSEFQTLLDQTNISGRTTNANFAVMDSTGAAAIFETGHTVYFKFDADDEPNGYVVRSNFAFNGGGSAGIERYRRTSKLVEDFYNGDSLNHKSILRYQMRDFSDKQSEYLSVPYEGSYEGQPIGYVETNISICRSTSVSAAVIQGTLPGELAGLATFWSLLGQPSTSVFVPYWVAASVPSKSTGATTAPICDVANKIRTQLFDLAAKKSYINTNKLLDGNGEGLWTKSFPFENKIISGVDSIVESWRSLSALPIAEMSHISDSVSSETHAQLLLWYTYLVTGQMPTEVIEIEENSVFANALFYPNPYTTEAVLSYNLKQPSKVVIEVYSLAGTKVGQNILYDQPAGFHHYEFGREHGNLPKGMLVVKLQANENSRYFKIIKK